jgi:hypothetical protein
MAKTAMIRARTEPDLKTEVDTIFQELRDHFKPRASRYGTELRSCLQW